MKFPTAATLLPKSAWDRGGGMVWEWLAVWEGRTRKARATANLMPGEPRKSGPDVSLIRIKIHRDAIRFLSRLSVSGVMPR